MKLSKRLLTIVNFVPKNSIVIDIGTDHGYVPIYLIKNNISKKVIATDISRNSLNKCEKYIKDLPFEGKIETRVGDGFEILKPFEADAAIIAGMGGLLIVDILEKRKDISRTITYFILQPMIASDEVRRYLYKNNFQIIDEKLIKEDEKFYEIIYAKTGKSHVEKEVYYEIGKKLIDNEDPLLEEFISLKINSANNIIKDIKDNYTPKSIERYKDLIKKIKEYREVLEFVKSKRGNKHNE